MNNGKNTDSAIFCSRSREDVNGIKISLNIKKGKTYCHSEKLCKVIWICLNEGKWCKKKT